MASNIHDQPLHYYETVDNRQLRRRNGAGIDAPIQVILPSTGSPTALIVPPASRIDANEEETEQPIVVYAEKPVVCT